MSQTFQADTIGLLLSDVSRLLRSAFDRRINASGLAITPGEARALIQVSIGCGVKQADIAARMGIEPMTLSTYLDRLEAMGLVTRVPAPDDGRAKNVLTTSDGEALLAALKPDVSGLMDAVLAGLDGEVREALRGNLRVLRNNLMKPDRCGAGNGSEGQDR
ncbi:MarR family winged helix-turn-helix transcriptional regulator [Mycoplana ramosa]|uniref:MarR family winged helix-turn-helix transcriptional regulator n=1 Tax=Mycoplana ramosa TaxID=40837 RepID=A0ABW3YUX6_MYCRA